MSTHEWQPWETIPEDGTLVWVVGKGWKRAYLGCIPHKFGALQFLDPYGWLRSGMEPTHWSPLVVPEPPK